MQTTPWRTLACECALSWNFHSGRSEKIPHDSLRSSAVFQNAFVYFSAILFYHTTGRNSPMARHLSRRLFLKGGALAAGALALAAFPEARTFAALREKAHVFFTRDIRPDSLLRLYARINQHLTGRIAIKLHTGEPNGPNILPRDWVRKLQAAIPAPLWSATFSLPALGMGSPEYEWIAL